MAGRINKERVEEIRQRRQRFEAALTGGGDDESVAVCKDIDWLLTALAKAEREREQAVATLREVRAQQREDYERADAARAEVERLKAECAEGDHGAWEDVYKRLIGIYNRLTNKRWFIGIVRNALQRTIKEHGPITAANQISAEKRLVGSILGEVLKEKSDATTLCSRCAEARAEVERLKGVEAVLATLRDALLG